jgi:hypothetical protein
MVTTFSLVRCVLVAVLLILTRGFVRASEPSQQPSTQEPSLAEKARELKAQQAQQSKPVRVFTNDNIPTGSGGITVIGGASAGPPEGSPKEHGEHYFRKTMSELQAKLELDQRQLAVLQQQLNINQLQYYPDPLKTLHQEYSRSDINKLQAEIEAKQQEIKSDEDAISDLRTELQRAGGDPGWLRVAPEGKSSSEKLESEGPKGKPGTKEYWESRFKSARAKLAKAQEIQQLTEDELRLLQIQQAREALNTDVAAELAQKIPAKQTEVDAARAATEKATQELEELQQEFAASGAPEEWSAEQ